LGNLKKSKYMIPYKAFSWINNYNDLQERRLLMVLQNKRALVMVLVMVLSFSQAGYAMQDAKYPYEEANMGKRMGLSISTIAKSFFTFGALISQAEGISPLPRHADGAEPHLGTPFQLNKMTLDLEDGATLAVTGLGDNNIAGVWWFSGTRANPFSEVVSRIVSPDGTTGSPEFNVSYYTSFPGHKFPSAIGCHNYFGVAWPDQVEVGDEGIIGRVYFENGTSTTPRPFTVSQDPRASLRDPSVGCLSNGNFIFVWRSVPYEPNDVGIFGRIFSPSGRAVTDTVSINAITVGKQSVPFVLGLKDGSFFVTWNSGFNLIGQSFENNGNPRGKEIIIHSAARPLAPARGAQFLNNGDIIIVYKNEPGRLVSRILRNGVPGDEFLIALGAGAFGVTTSSQTGLALVAYGAETGRGIVGQFFFFDGTPTKPFNISPLGEVPSVTSLTNGRNFFVAWNEKEAAFSKIKGREVSLQLPSRISSPYYRD
jgi:hypothetical protein